MTKSNDYKKLESARDLFLDMATIYEDMIALGKREDQGEDVTKETEALAGRFLMKTIEMSNLGK